KKHVSYGRTDKLERYADIALESSQRAAALTHRLLAFSRRQPLTPKPVDIINLINNIEMLLRRSMGPSHLLEIRAQHDLWLTVCDPHQLENAILNLTINARDALGEEGKLLIELENCPGLSDGAQGDYVRIGLTDNGTGMSAEVMERAIEPFFTTKPMGEGTGLGLSMVYGFARQSEGRLNILSVEGKGTTINLYLPRYQGQVQEDTSGPIADPQKSMTRETVLLVEDDPAIRELIPEVLEELGYLTLVASDGYEGLEILQNQPGIDLLITDIGLPGLNGRDLAAKALRINPTLKVLFITGYDQNVTLQKSLHQPGVELITKPFTIAGLASKISSMTKDS
ncbi:response regulator, partial [Pseudomonas duriflava]|uniref:response regulator n=1 Tax=Pseudomonas duriflava TaxID=459528 RepID=UPI00119F35C3